jgi:hypothetical protein
MPKPGLSTAPSRRKSIASLTGLCTLTLALTTTGCATPMPPSQERSPLPANLTAPCPNLTPLDGPSGASVLRKLVEVAEAYYECQRRHRALAEAVGP